MSSSVIDLSQLPAPAVVEELDFETILEALVADYKERYPDFDADLESDPVYKVLETAAYREVTLRQRVNDAAKAVMLAYATGTDLDNLAALQEVGRLVVDEGDPDAVPPVDPTYETDARLRYRVQLAPEGQTTAGPTGSYEFWAVSASADVRDVDVSSPAACHVVVTVLSSAGDGTPDADLLSTVDAALNTRDVRPLTDQVTVQAATIVPYAIVADLTLYEGPDAETVRQAAEEAVTQYASDHHLLGHDITLSGLYAALHQAGVQKVILASPTADLVIAANEASYCTSVAVTVGGTDE
jgi:phage-related baseplate assembly protein